MEYPKSTLALRRGKWNVCVTVPTELRSQFTDKQIRRSTGTADAKEAGRRQHSIAAEIYAKFDDASVAGPRDVWYDILRKIGYMPIEDFTEHADGHRLYPVWFDEDRATKFSKLEETIRIERSACQLRGNAKHDRIVQIVIDHLAEAEKELMQLRLDAPPITQITTALTGSINNKTISALHDAYLGSLTDSNTKYAKLAMKKFIEHHGDMSIEEITVPDVAEWFEELSEVGLSNSGIKQSKAFMSGLFKWCSTQRGFTLSINPFLEVSATGYGTSAQARKPLTHDQLHQLFALPLSEQERAVFGILVTTGMRVGEALQIEPSRDIHTALNGQRYFDLREMATKTKGSKRIVPIHPAINGLIKDSGKKFAVTQDALLKRVREVTDDPTIVTHSLRHTFKDLARDAGITKEISDFISGHSQGDVASKYGSGPSLEVRAKALNSIEHPWLSTK